MRKYLKIIFRIFKFSLFKSLIKTLPVLFIFIALGSCYYNSKELLYPELNSSCDTLDVTYSAGVVPILSASCYTCHNATVQNGNINLTDYDRVSALAVTLRNGTPVLLGVIGHMSGFTAMPPTGKLSDCDIKIIQNWIESGAPDN